MVTLREVAEKAGVSIATASCALNNSPKVSKRTKEKILEAAKELKYTPNKMARSLKKRKTETIGLFLSDFGGPFYSDLIKGVQKVVMMNGYDMIVCSTYGGEKSTGYSFLKEKGVDGAIILSSDISDEQLKDISRKDFPIILLDRELYLDNIYNVLISNKKGAYDATQYLAQKGYKTIGCIMGPVDSYDAQERYNGYLDAMADVNLPVIPNFSIRGDFTEDGGYQAVRIMLASQKPDAIFCSNDEMALGALKAINEKGMNVPHDIALIGFDDIILASYIKPSLTTISHPKYEWGTTAAQILFQALNKGYKGKNIVLPTKLIIRETT